MRVIRESKNVFYIEGIATDGFFWVDEKSTRVDDEKTAILLLDSISNTMSVRDANLALLEWARLGCTNKDF